jgi:hypothetical protein
MQIFYQYALFSILDLLNSENVAAGNRSDGSATIAWISRRNGISLDVGFVSSDLGDANRDRLDGVIKISTDGFC